MTHDQAMLLAIAQAEQAMRLGEVPVGCIILDTDGNTVLASAHNRRHAHPDPTAHAEIHALRQAAQARGHWRLTGCTLVVTLEPCPMCAGALVNARCAQVVYGCADPKAGAVRTLYNLCDDPRLNHRLQVVSGVMAERCAQLLQDFFRAQRALGKK